MKRSLRAPLALLFAMLLLAAPTTSPADDAPLEAPDVGGGGKFDLGCRFSHSLPDDPIVFPGQPGASHLHDFFGFQRTDAFTTPEDLQAALEEDPIPTTCSEAGHDGRVRARNVSGYWSPSAYVNGIKVDPEHVHVYYRNTSKHDVETPPPGFVIIAGNHMDSKSEQAEKLVWWCQRIGDGSVDSLPADCLGKDSIRASISFPTCWNGDRDSDDHRSHVVYAQDHGGSCPRSHPRRLPRIVLHVRFNVRGALGRPFREGDVLTLSSGPQYTMHADYMFGWDQERLDTLIRECLNAGRDCKNDPPD